MTFNELNLSAPLLRAVAEAGYETPSPIQAKAIPPVAEGRDLMGCAQTGTGKTAAFALPMLLRLSAMAPKKKGAIRALILTPTRELALQIGDSFAQYGRYLSVTHTVIFGGVGQAPQVAALKKGVDVLVACPGRLNDLIGQGYIDLANVEIFVLDEADRMLDMGFVHDVKKVIAKLPKVRQNLMFSATMPKEIEALAAGILHEPAFVKVDPVSSTVDRIEQSLYYVEKGNKRFLLPYLIKNQKPAVTSALVFSRTKHGADKIVRELEKEGIPAAAIHGNKSQNARVAALEGFKAGKTRVLVATDIAARGIDISELSHVFNYDLPEVPETYVHRIGRTARAGADGCAISFCAPEEREYLAGIEKLNRRAIPVVAHHPWAGKPAPARTEPPVRGRRSAPAEKIMPQPAAKSEECTMDETNQNAAAEAGLSASAKRRRRRRRSGSGENAAPAAQAGRTAQSQNTVNQQNTPQGRNAAGRSNPQGQAAKAARPQNGPAQGRSGQNHPGTDRQSAPRGPRPASQPKFDPHFLTPDAAPKPAGSVSRAAAARRDTETSGAPAAAQRGAGQNGRPAAPRRRDTENGSPRGDKTALRDSREPRRAAPTAPRAKNGPIRPDEDGGLELIARRPPQQKFTSFDDYMAAHGGATAPIEGENEE